ncbi:MAG: hypothetical protein BGO67_03865 [Alphaproteobacteria bacterium 41-28]|nr:MAG: hypothetical protein BGO67_03865 [Alphaproteobacteria bacterium 41-28]
MKNNILFFPRAVYQRYLTVVEGIHFTRREVDVMACLLYARNTGKIASLLNIASTTVTTHIQNIMEKLKCNSRESIIDFVEGAHNVDIIKKYYVSLIIHSTFKRSLRACSKIINNPASLPLIVYCEDQQAQSILSYYLPIHLKLAGIEAEIQSQKLEPFDYQIKGAKYQKSSQEMQSAKKVLIIILKQEDKAQKKLLRITNKYRFNSILIDFNEQKSYCLTVFEILKKLFPRTNFDAAASQFTKTCETLERSHKTLPAELGTSFPEKGENGRGRQHRSQIRCWKKYGKRTSRRIVSFFHSLMLNLKKNAIGAYGFAFLLFGLVGLWLFFKAPENKQDQVPTALSGSLICSDLVIPKEPVLLPRPKLIAQVEDRFKLSKSTQVVALIGPGGSGKTTLARYYARNQSSWVVWEANAESRESLKASYEELAKALAKEEIDKRKLRAIDEITDPKERETELLHFIKERLRTYLSWILIYDNFGRVADIKDYFPKDFEDWGTGKVLITTRNVNIRNNMYVDHVVSIGPLKPEEKYELFWKIIEKGGSEEENIFISPPTVNAFQDKKMDEKIEKKIKEFLKEIPPFPLDVSVAAYYLRSTSTPYHQYLESSLKHSSQFVNLQEDILKEAGDYTKTRYGIITLSIQQVININKDFRDLLFLISLIDSQNIPRNLLNKYKDNETVDSLVYHLKHYSLIMSPSLDFISLPHHSTISFHRSTHAILLNYLKQLLIKNKGSKPLLISSISDALEHFMRVAIENEDLAQIDRMKPHLKAFLSHGTDMLNDNNKGAIEAELGCAYYYTHYHETAKSILTSSISTLKSCPSKENYQRVAQALSYLGNLHKDMGDHQKARGLLEEAITLYKQHDPYNYIGIVRALTYLGDTHKNLGEHRKAKDVLEKSFALAQKHLGSNQIGLARTMLHLGIVYRDLEDYENAIPLLRSSLTLFETYFPENYIERVRALKYLGNTYRSLGRYEEAKGLLKQSVLLSKKYLPENHIALGRSLVHLAIIYKRLGEYKKAQELFTEALKIHENIFGKENVRTAWVITHLATIHQEMGEWEKAQDTISKCLRIYLHAYGRNSLRTSWVLMQLGYVYEDLGEYRKAQEILEEALKIHRKHFSENHQKIGELSFHLGNIYKGLGHYKKANELLQRAVKIYERHYGQNHIETARILGSLSDLYLHTGNLNEAEEIANKSLAILQYKQHPSQFLLYETLAEIHLQRAIVEENKGRTMEAKTFKMQVVKELEQALAIIRPLFPKDSAHVIRIQGKLKSAWGN